jgi:hypothetical protein
MSAPHEQTPARKVPVLAMGSSSTLKRDVLMAAESGAVRSDVHCKTTLLQAGDKVAASL